MLCLIFSSKHKTLPSSQLFLLLAVFLQMSQYISHFTFILQYLRKLRIFGHRIFLIYAVSIV